MPVTAIQIAAVVHLETILLRPEEVKEIIKMTPQTMLT
jgi:hypothetical protein